MKLLHQQLFWCEKYHTLLKMEELPHLTSRQVQELKEWGKNHRKILSYEVHQQLWLKLNKDGFPSVLDLKPNGSLVEKDVFSENIRQGAWKVSDGFLFVKVISNEFIIEYQIVGNSVNNIHCGMEYINGTLSTYCKFAKLAKD